MNENKTISLKEPIFITFYGDTISHKYTSLVLLTYPYPENSNDRGMVLLPEIESEDEITVSVNLCRHLPKNKIVINVNENLINNQVLPELIKQKIISAEPDFSIPSGFVEFPVYTILI